MFRLQNSVKKASDATLVVLSLGGNRWAFCEIVSRYQSLLCSIAYARVGDIRHSEDIAQEAFIEAWKKLDSLSDHEKLKAWLCGILRFKVSHFRRKENALAGKNTDELQDDSQLDIDLEELEQTAIDEQHEALLWATLESLDETYRAPLILFYRQQQSIERVAAELDLTPDTAKQRLSRGRKMLKSAMSTFVEDTLQKTKPGVAFTAAVFTAINGISPPAKAAVVGAGSANASWLLKLTSFLPILAASSGFIGAFFGLQASLDQTKTKQERIAVKRGVAAFMGVALAFVALMFACKYMALSFDELSLPIAVISQCIVALFVLVYIWLTFNMISKMRATRAHQRIIEPQAFNGSQGNSKGNPTEYISPIRLFGVPLYHFQLGMPEQNYQPAVAWVAGGTFAKGLLFAWGAVAIAPVSVGIVSVGVVTVGAVGVGVLSAGTVAFGILAFGASAVGYQAFSSLSSLGWESALSGGFAIAKNAALGTIAFAEHANTEHAAQVSQLPLFSQTFQWALALIALLVIAPAVIYAKQVRKAFRKE